MIDFFSQLIEGSAKEAAHLLAMMFELEPYGKQKAKTAGREQPRAKTNGSREVREGPDDREVSREEFENLRRRFNRLSNIVFSQIMDEGSGSREDAGGYDVPVTENHAA